MGLKFQIDTDSIAAQFKEFSAEVKADMKKAIDNLVTLTRTRIVEQAQKELHSSRDTYLANLSNAEEISPGVWVISLDQPALWIEEGIEKNKDMKPDLLKGKPYRIIPFRYDKPKSQNTVFTQNLISQIKQELRKVKIPYKKIEYNENGSPRLGKLHEINIKSSIPGKGNTPALHGLSIYQHEKAGKVKREILTFRTVTSGPSSTGKWIYPGLDAKKFMDKALAMAIVDFEQSILPEIMKKWSK